jgi:hypothetical protein
MALRKNMLLISILIFSFSFLVSCNATKIVEENYEMITLYKLKNDQLEKVSELKDKKKIEELTKLINSSETEDAEGVVFEKGPDGLLVFEKKEKKLELKIFTDNGNILTDKHYVNSGIDVNGYFNQ